MENVRVRFAPSPTGKLHIGSMRTALFNWLFARHHGGKFILRIEDTDRTRFVDGATENIIEALQWYGLDFDEGPIFQSERTEVYKKCAAELVKQGSAYYCFCSHERLEELRQVQIANKQAPKYDGHCRNLDKAEVDRQIKSGEPYVIRLKIPAGGQTEFDDIIRGRVSFENKDIDDQVLIKSDGFPTYHLANVVDDHDENITHVIRAEEWLPSTPKHILLYQAFGWSLPQFAHLPMVLGTDRSKLSKRHGAVPALDYRELGYLPEAVLNFITLLGWNPKTEREIFSTKELIQEFDLSKVNKSGSIFNLEKLNWLNSQYIKKMNIDDLVKARRSRFEQLGYKIGEERLLRDTVELEKDRLTTLNDPSEVASFLLTDELKYDPKIIVPKNETVEITKQSLELIIKKLGELSDGDFSRDKLKTELEKLITEHKLSNKQVLWPLRVAITGLEKSPGVFEVMEVIGRDRTIKRVEEARRQLK
jgi:glutamyl-tRNA synthetase